MDKVPLALQAFHQEKNIWQEKYYRKELCSPNVETVFNVREEFTNVDAFD